jgi:F5/8 type C domain
MPIAREVEPFVPVYGGGIHMMKRPWSQVSVLALGLLILVAAGMGTAQGSIPNEVIGTASVHRPIQSNSTSENACDKLTDAMERDLCRFVTSIYPEGLLTNWPNPHLPGHFDHAPMFVYTDTRREAVSESTSMLALYAALIGDETTFDYLFGVSAPAEIGGTGAAMSSTQESPYYFGSPNLCLLHWILDESGYKKDWGTGWLANAGGEENRWLEALSVADRKFPKLRYRQFANCLAWGLMGATDFDVDAVGNFEDPGTPEVCDDFLLRHQFRWEDDFSAFATITSTNLSYNNLMGWRYAAQLGQEPHPLYQTTDGTGGSEVITIPLQTVGAVRLDLTRAGTDYGYSLWEIEAHSPFTTTNLLLHADCAASSHRDDENCQACTCQKALDGDLATRWSSEQPAYPGDPLPPQWLVITPTQPSRVMTITLRWETAYASSYNVTASWPFADFYGNVLSCTAPLMADSIRQCGTDLPRVMYDVRRHFYYGEILAPNLALTMDATATASSTQDGDPALSPGKAIDGDLNTRWSSDWNDDEWIALQFSEPVTIDGVVLKWERAYGKAYTIDVSDDDVTWTPVYTESNGKGDDTDLIIHEVHFPLTMTRHVRMHGLTRGTEWGYSLREFEVYRGGTSSLTALDLGRRAGAYAKVIGDTALWEMGQRILRWYKASYPSSIAAAYDPCTGNPLPGWENGEWPSIMADLAELAAEYGDCSFARQVIEEKLADFSSTSAFENLEVLLALRHVDERCGVTSVYLPLAARSYAAPASLNADLPIQELDYDSSDERISTGYPGSNGQDRTKWRIYSIVGDQ